MASLVTNNSSNNNINLNLPQNLYALNIDGAIKSTIKNNLVLLSTNVQFSQREKQQNS